MAKHFWRHVCLSASNARELGARLTAALIQLRFRVSELYSTVLRERTGQSKITDLGVNCAALSLMVHKYVLRLQVSVNHVCLVHIDHALHYLTEDG